MLIHPDVHLEIARQRHHDLRADARGERMAGRRDGVIGRIARRAARGTKPRATRAPRADWGSDAVLMAADHFGHRDAGGLVVDLFWNPSNPDDEFRVEVEDERDGTRFVLRPTTGREAIQAFHHPFSAARAPAQRPATRAS